MKSLLFLRAVGLLTGLSLLAGGPVLADSVWIKGSAGGKALERQNVKILDVKDGMLTFESGGNIAAPRPLTDVVRVRIDGEISLNAAEDAFAGSEFDKATTNYEKTLQTTTKPWLKDWCSARLLESASKSGRFDAAVKAFVALAERSPEAAKTMLASMEMPKKDSKYLVDADRQLEAGIKASRRDDARQVMAELRANVARARGDTKAEEEALKAAAAAAMAANPNSPEALRHKVQLTLNSARQALTAKDYDKVLGTLEKEGATIIEPADQIEALMLVADAKAGKAAASTDANAWKDVVVAYLRVVANAPAGSPQSGAALLKVASIHETKLNEKPAAVKVYQQVVADFKGQDAAKEAEKELKRLQG
jgi:hypothetical protein